MKQGSASLASTARVSTPPSVRQPTSYNTVSRGEVRAHAMELQHHLRTLLAELEITCVQRPQPKTMVRDVVHGRSASEETIFAAIIAVARVAPPEALLRFAQQFFTLLSTYTNAPASQSPEVTLDQETMAQADGDVWQRRGVEAMRTGDLPTLSRAIDATTAHLWHAQQFLVHMLTAKTALQSRRRHALAARC